MLSVNDATAALQHALI